MDTDLCIASPGIYSTNVFSTKEEKRWVPRSFLDCAPWPLVLSSLLCPLASLWLELCGALWNSDREWISLLPRVPLWARPSVLIPLRSLSRDLLQRLNSAFQGGHRIRPIAVVSPTPQLPSFLLLGALWLPGRSCCDLLIPARSRPALHSH